MLHGNSLHLIPLFHHSQKCLHSNELYNLDYFPELYKNKRVEIQGIDAKGRSPIPRMVTDQINFYQSIMRGKTILRRCPFEHSYSEKLYVYTK